ncbi:Magnesium-dependent phosphatase 1 [Bulinus truncatus]|nr:Magnesium-dependent phosphatase 1 [Bulinus truncatus]
MFLFSSLLLKNLAVRSCLSTLVENCSKSFSYCTMVEPKLIVFDLDYTLWPYWVDTHVDPPFHQTSDGKVYDAHRRPVTYFKDVPDILKQLYNSGFQLAIASRTSAIQEANDLTRLFNWDQFFHYRQIYPGSKITHFKKLHSLSGIPYSEMLFYDDEHRNIVDVSSLGVACMFVPDGISKESFQKGLELFQKHKAAIKK